jgi:hypothetical protein
MKWHVSDCQFIDSLYPQRQTNKTFPPPRGPKGRKNLSLLGCMQPPFIGWAEFTLLPKCVPHRIPQHFWPSLMRGVGSMGVYSHTSILSQPSYNGFPRDGALLGARSHNPGSHSLSCWLLYSRGNSPSLIFVWAAIPNSFSRSIKQTNIQQKSKAGIDSTLHSSKRHL